MMEKLRIGQEFVKVLLCGNHVVVWRSLALLLSLHADRHFITCSRHSQGSVAAHLSFYFSTMIPPPWKSPFSLITSSRLLYFLFQHLPFEFWGLPTCKEINHNFFTDPYFKKQQLYSTLSFILHFHRNGHYHLSNEIHGEISQWCRVIGDLPPKPVP